MSKKDKCNHNWVRRGCASVCENCGKKRVKHIWEEVFDDPAIPIAEFKRCVHCKKLKDNDGPNRPPTHDTFEMLQGQLEELEERKEVHSFIRGDNYERIWFSYPGDCSWALSEVYGRSREQIQWLLGVDGALLQETLEKLCPPLDK